MGWSGRLAWGGLAIAGSGLYAWAWQRHGGGPFAAWGPRVALAAGISWFVFGAALGVATRLRPSLMAWVDACLKTMGPGIVPLIVAAGLVVGGLDSATLHLGLLALSDLGMLLLFLRQARGLGMPPRGAVLLWVAALNGAFALLLWGMR